MKRKNKDTSKSVISKKENTKKLPIKNEDYAKFVIPTEETTNIITGEIDEIEFDFSDADGSSAEKKDAEGNMVSVKNLKELKAQIKLDKVKRLKRNQTIKSVWGGKALRYKKGQKDGKGGQVMKSDVANAFRNIAKKEDISVSKAITKYQNTSPTAKTRQAFGQHDFDLKLPTINNNELVVKVKDSSGKVYRFTGTGESISKDPHFQKIKTRNLNRIYKAIKPKTKLDDVGELRVIKKRKKAPVYKSLVKASLKYSKKQIAAGFGGKAAKKQLVIKKRRESKKRKSYKVKKRKK
jgi:hypothetical protein